MRCVAKYCNNILDIKIETYVKLIRACHIY
jgi:hypothetical protein